MILEARSAGCFSWTFVLKANDRPLGKYVCRWLSEDMEIHLTERRHLELRKVGWISSRFELVDLEGEQLVAWCDRAGIFTSRWDVDLSVGAGELKPTGWFNTAYEFFLEGVPLAKVDGLGWCEWGWVVDGHSDLTDEDHLMLGLVYQIIQRRQRQNNAGHAGGS
jgi:hypothetical protein